MGYPTEVDTSDLFLWDKVSRYRMIIGCSNRAVTLGRFDVHFSVSTIGRYNYTPRKGDIGAMLKIFGYLKHNTNFGSYMILESWSIKERLIYPDFVE